MGIGAASAASWLTPANGSAIAGYQGTARGSRDSGTGPLLLPPLESRQRAAKSPAHSHGLQHLQLPQPHLPTCVTREPWMPSGHIKFRSSCI